MLRTLGVPPQQIPDDLAARAALYRDRLSGKRMLVVLDNANSEDQIRPLMPGHPACLVLVTSRRRLKGLDEARVLSLEVLPAPDAVALLRAVAGPGRLLVGDPLLEEIAQLCGRLPLALRIAAALLRHRPSWRLAHLADKLRHTYPALAAFHDGDRDLAALFDLSYQALDDDQQRLYRHLGLNPGPDIDPYAAAALLQDTPARAERLLEDLIDHSLLLGHAPGRYRMHDLIRDHTRALSTATDPAEQRQQAQRRLLDYYQHTATRANALITHTPRDEQGGCTPPHAPTLKNAEQARMWLRSERASLEAAFDHAAKHGWDEHTVPLGAGMAELLHVDGPWPRAVAVHEIAVAAARRVGDQLRLAAALTDLGKAHNRIDDGASATNLLTLAHQIYRDYGDRLGQANVLAELSIGQIGIGNYQDAHDQLNQALMFYRELDNRLGQAHTLTLHACIWQVTGDSARAIDAATHALSLYRDLDNPQGQVGALNFLGRARALNKDYAEAETVLNHALDLSRGIGHRLGEAVALAFLGTTRCFAGEYAQALETLGHALTLLRELGDRSSEANTLNYYAASLLGTGDIPQALATYRDALFLARDVSQPDDEALALEGIGECLLKTGDTDTGIDHLRQALKIYQHLGLHPDIERVQTRLADPAP